MIDKKELAGKVYDACHLTGTFTLRSGQVSSEYFDKYRFNAYPDILWGIMDYMLPLIPEDTDMLAGLEMGAIPIATALSLKSGMICQFVRKKAKTYGTCKLAEGPDIAGKKLCVIEDVVTTGGQIIESVRALRELGAVVDTVLCVILRNPEAAKLLAGEGLTLKHVFTMEELKA